MNFNSQCPKLPWMVDFFTTEDGKVYNTQLDAAFANTYLEYLSTLSLKSRPAPFRETQLVCSIPSNISCNAIEDLIQLGIGVAKITATETQKVLETLSKIRAVNSTYSRNIGRLIPLGIAIEIKGPSIRIGQLKEPNKKVTLEKGKLTTITTDPTYEEHVTEDMIFVDYQNLPSVIQPGDKVLLDNGSVTLSALECVESIIRCIVEKAGDLLSNASVILPNAAVELPMLSANDQELVSLALGECIDFIFLSDIYSKEGIVDVKDLLGEDGKGVSVITKIENSLAIEHIDKIIEVSDGICIDCERLMVELPKEKVFLVQKSTIAKCNLAGKPVICSIKISDVSDISKSEVSDIANAIIDGTDALLIPEDCFKKDVVKSVAVICKEAEPAVYQRQIFNELAYSIKQPMEAIYSLTISAVESTLKTNAAAIICLTSSGRTAKLLARFRPRCPIITITRYARVARQLAIYKGIEAVIYLRPFEGDWDKDVEQRVQLGVTYGKYVGYIRMGDAVVTVTGSRPESGMPNCIKVVYASQFDTLPRKPRI